MKTNRKAGFTLIELLVVIAIIGILSSIVLVSLNSARSKGTNVRIQGETNQIRTALEAEFNGSVYPTLGATAGGSAIANIKTQTINTSIATLATDIYNLNGNTDTAIYATSSDAGYAVVSTFSGGGKVCYDSVGNASTVLSVQDNISS